MIGSAVSEPPPSVDVELGGALQQTRVQVEDVARIRFASRRPAQQERDFPVGLRVLREVVVDDQRVAARVAEELAERARRVRAEVEERRRIGRSGRHDDRVAHRVGFFERPDDLRDRGLLLPDRVVDADDAGVLLIQDRVDGDGRFPGLPIADDELALAAADRHHRVDRLQPGLQRLLHALAIDNARAPGARSGENCLVRNRTLAVDRRAEGVDDAAEQLFADRHRDDAAGALDDVAFLDLLELAEQHRADALLLEVQRDAEHSVRELEHLAGHRLLDAVHPRDAVAERHDGPDLGHVHVDRVASNLLADDLGDFFSFDVHVAHPRAGRSESPATCFLCVRYVLGGKTVRSLRASLEG